MYHSCNNMPHCLKLKVYGLRKWVYLSFTNILFSIDKNYSLILMWSLWLMPTISWGCSLDPFSWCEFLTKYEDTMQLPSRKKKKKNMWRRYWSCELNLEPWWDVHSFLIFLFISINKCSYPYPCWMLMVLDLKIWSCNKL